MRAHCEHPLPAPMDLRKGGQPLLAKTVCKPIHQMGVRHRNELRAVTRDLRCQQFDVFPGRQCFDAEPRRQRLNYAEALPANRACGTENSQTFQEPRLPFKATRLPREMYCPPNKAEGQTAVYKANFK